MVPALVRLLAGVGTFVDGERAALYEAFPAIGEVAVIRPLISVNPVVPCQIRFAIEPLLRYSRSVSGVGLSQVSQLNRGVSAATETITKS